MPMPVVGTGKAVRQSLTGEVFAAELVRIRCQMLHPYTSSDPAEPGHLPLKGKANLPYEVIL